MDSLSEFFAAARMGDAETVREHLEAGIDVASLNEYGQTALHCAAIGSNTADIGRIVEVMNLLIEFGAPLDSIGTFGLTPLYTAAEMTQALAPVQVLLDAGANPNVTNLAGIDIVTNAMIPDVKKLLSDLTGIPLPVATKIDFPMKVVSMSKAVEHFSKIVNEYFPVDTRPAPSVMVDTLLDFYREIRIEHLDEWEESLLLEWGCYSPILYEGDQFVDVREKRHSYQRLDEKFPMIHYRRQVLSDFNNTFFELNLYFDTDSVSGALLNKGNIEFPFLEKYDENVKHFKSNPMVSTLLVQTPKYVSASVGHD